MEIKMPTIEIATKEGTHSQGYWARAWARFKSQRRALLSLWLFVLCFALSLGAELISNDKPYLVSYHEQLYFPLLKDYP